MSDSDISKDIANKLTNVIERVERLESERKELAEEIKEVFAEAKAYGLDVKIIKLVIKLRKRSADDIEEEQSLLDLYKNALGMLV